MVSHSQTIGPSSAVEVGEAEEFASLLKQSFRPRNETAENEIDNAISTLVRQVLADQDVVGDEVIDTIKTIISRLDAKLSDQVNAIFFDDNLPKG